MSGTHIAHIALIPGKLTAARQIEVLRRWPPLAARLMRRGLSEADAKAVAYNAAIVYCAMKDGGEFKSPNDVLETFSLEEIAAFCKRIEEAETNEN